MLYALISLVMATLPAVCATPSKPDMAKVYKDAQTWAQQNLKNHPITPLQGGCARAGLMNPKALPCGKIEATAHGNAKAKQPQNTPHEERILVFVSASMPLASLQSLLQDAQSHQATLVMRGLQGNSFKDTAAFIQKLTSGLTSTQGIDLDPELFTRFNVTHVPVFIRLKGDQELARLSGNVSLAFASSKLREEA